MKKQLLFNKSSSAGIAIAALIASGSAWSDQVILDDLIVDGSACIGRDCVNGESFGFDTIRLKENNLRIKAQDTSSTASFPSRDWQLTFNDSSNGGANKFSVDDIDGGRTPFTIEAGAPSHSLYVDDGGRIGIGTSTPVVQVHNKDGNTPTLRLEQDGSSGFTPQTWDVAGNEANFFVRDATNGSTLPFKIKPGAPTSSLFVAADGDIGLGTESPETRLHIKDTSSDPGITLEEGTSKWKLTVNSASDRFQITNVTNGTSPLKIDDAADNNLMKLGTDAASNRVEINGDLYINNALVTPDYVFGPDYKLESIEEHASLMWNNNHLPGIVPHTVNSDGKTVIQVGVRSQGLLLELEKAHIYIAELNDSIKSIEAEKQNLALSVAALRRDFEKRLRNLER